MAVRMEESHRGAERTAPDAAAADAADRSTEAGKAILETVKRFCTKFACMARTPGEYWKSGFEYDCRRFTAAASDFIGEGDTACTISAFAAHAAAGNVGRADLSKELDKLDRHPRRSAWFKEEAACSIVNFHRAAAV